MTDEPIANWTNEDNVFVGKHPAWYRHAACYGKSGDLFFEEGVRRLVIEAKSYCIKCPVRIDCLEHAITHEEVGVWGGLTERQRFTVKRYRRDGLLHPLDPARFDER